MDDDTRTLAEALEELASAEDFLDYFAVPYDTGVVQVNRLHILQRFHDYLARQAPELPQEEAAQHAIYRLWLARAYQDFVASDALTEKVFAVFQHVQKPGGGSTSFVPLDKVFQKRSTRMEQQQRWQRWDYGEPVRLTRNVRNDGTYPGYWTAAHRCSPRQHRLRG